MKERGRGKKEERTREEGGREGEKTGKKISARLQLQIISYFIFQAVDIITVQRFFSITKFV